MRRETGLRLSAGVLAALVAAFAAWGWADAERRTLAAAEAEGRALLRAVAAGIGSNLDAGRAVGNLVGDGLVAVAAEADADLARAAADPSADPSAVLESVRAARALRGIVWLGDDLEVRAFAAAPAPGLAATDAAAAANGDDLGRARAARIAAETLARRARDAGLAGQARVDLGLRDSPFGARTEAAVAVRAHQAGGHLIVRSDADALERFRSEAGIDRLLAEAARSDAIAYLALEAEDGLVLAARPSSLVGTRLPGTDRDAAWRRVEGGARVLDVRLPTPSGAGGAAALRAGLAAATVDPVIDGARRSILFATALLLVTGPGGLLLLAERERRTAAREAALRREIEDRERFAALGRLAATVAHEVRSPLNAMSIAAQRLAREARPREEPERARFDELHGAAQRAIRRIDRTIEEFVGLAKPAAPLAREPVDVAALVDEVLRSEELRVRVAAPPAAVRVEADRVVLGRALANLVRNAVQCADPATVVVGWRQEGADAVIDVDDGGPGIPEDERERVFEPFRTKRPGGLGLGLTIARDAVRRHGGEVTAGAAPGGGARFSVRLPLGGAR